MLRAATQRAIAARGLPKGFSRGFRSSRAMAKEIELFVDGKAVQIEEGSAIIQAAEKAGVTIPRFCYHERLGIAGNCRMCLVEIEKSPKLAASCAMPVGPGMRVLTDTPKIKQAREGVMEFLLANHPLDCPICDQGGECDLQDQSMRYGADRGRFGENKRAVEDKDIGPLVKTTMTRCIHCTRCVRFINEVAGTGELGTTGRGNDMQIGTYVQRPLVSELSGNIIDLCPVGALTSKPYAFSARPWELKNTESIDVTDALGSNIRVDSRGEEVMRVIPRTNDEINEEWISDKARFSNDGLKRQRLTTPLVRVGDKFEPASWADALGLVAERLTKAEPSRVRAVAGDLADAESLVALKDLMNSLGSENLAIDTMNSGRAPAYGVDVRSNYSFNAGIANLEDADAVLLIGTNPRHEAAVLNARLRKPYLAGTTQFAVIGRPVDLTYDYQHVGETAAAIDALAKDEHPFAKVLKAAQRPVVIVGGAVGELDGGADVMASVARLAQSVPALVGDAWNGLSVLQYAAGRMAALDIGFVPNGQSSSEKPEFVYLLGADEIRPSEIPTNAFVVYQGHHGDAGAHLADVILPGAAYTEKSTTFVNTEGRAQLTRQAVNPPGAARDDWKIVRALSEAAGMTLPYDDVNALRARMADVCPLLVHVGEREPTSFAVAKLGLQQMATGGSGRKGALDGRFVSAVEDFYMTDVISRASRTMARASASVAKAKSSGFASDEVGGQSESQATA
ncbi:ndufs1 NADH-ubiquinone oxidoreductase subunit [Coemansia sp. RSA 1722]|nr:ndufs1 NADH-ubiquinone oxidoreductase subunit [Coemansia sp. RSA 486]KAJ2236493.1 ndufs1 NADH-ubiquinone oxidoreductase subunit [Coemansia sp. RSA 485]KAJ2597140.1 ndufs1 NADH-ubiquinone oxidoreductase subunit [Coemansia sp. RSA 1722]KAJ2600361.1 ndufs1 NADH-ubiquinone oxidoreductase subunit [Coemansia sp. RSA 1721]